MPVSCIKTLPLRCPLLHHAEVPFSHGIGPSILSSASASHLFFSSLYIRRAIFFSPLSPPFRSLLLYNPTRHILSPVASPFSQNDPSYLVNPLRVRYPYVCVLPHSSPARYFISIPQPFRCTRSSLLHDQTENNQNYDVIAAVIYIFFLRMRNLDFGDG